MRWVWSRPNEEVKRSLFKSTEDERTALLDKSLPYQEKCETIKEDTKKYINNFEMNRNIIQTHQNPYLKTNYIEDLKNEDLFLRPKSSCP